MVSRPAAYLSTLIDRFVAGGSFMELWSPFMDFVGDESDAAPFTPAEREAFNRLYDLVYMGQEGVAGREEGAVGLVGEVQLRAQLRAFRWDGSDVMPI